MGKAFMNKMKALSLILVIVLVVFFVLHSGLKNSGDEQRQTQQALRVELTKLEEENKELLSKLNLAGTDEYIMANAVKKYSYVKKDAIRFEYTNPEAIYAYTDQEMQILMDEMSN